jgi:hypothetical protein
MDKIIPLIIVNAILIVAGIAIYYVGWQEQENAHQLQLDTIQERLEDITEQHEMERTIQERQQYRENNLVVFSYYQENNTIDIMTLASANGTIQVKIEPLPGIYPEHDNITVSAEHTWMFEHDSPLVVQQMDSTTWRWNVSIDDTTEHWFSISNASLDEYVVYVTKELEPLDDYYFMPLQREYIIKINRR